VINITIAIYRYLIGTSVRVLRDSGAFLDYVAHPCALRLLRDGFYITDVAIRCEGIIIRMRYLSRTSCENTSMSLMSW